MARPRKRRQNQRQAPSETTSNDSDDEASSVTNSAEDNPPAAKEIPPLIVPKNELDFDSLPVSQRDPRHYIPPVEVYAYASEPVNHQPQEEDRETEYEFHSAIDIKDEQLQGMNSDGETEAMDSRTLAADTGSVLPSSVPAARIKPEPPLEAMTANVEQNTTSVANNPESLLARVKKEPGSASGSSQASQSRNTSTSTSNSSQSTHSRTTSTATSSSNHANSTSSVQGDTSNVVPHPSDPTQLVRIKREPGSPPDRNANLPVLPSSGAQHSTGSGSSAEAAKRPMQSNPTGTAATSQPPSKAKKSLPNCNSSTHKKQAEMFSQRQREQESSSAGSPRSDRATGANGTSETVSTAANGVPKQLPKPSNVDLKKPSAKAAVPQKTVQQAKQVVPARTQSSDSTAPVSAAAKPRKATNGSQKQAAPKFVQTQGPSAPSRPPTANSGLPEPFTHHASVGEETMPTNEGLAGMAAKASQCFSIGILAMLIISLFLGENQSHSNEQTGWYVAIYASSRATCIA